MSRQKTQYLKFKGQIAWAHHLFTPDEWNGEEKYKVNLYVDKETKSKMKAAGIQLRPKYDDGEKSGITGEYVTPKREVLRTFRGEEKLLDPLKILDQKGRPYINWVLEDGKWIPDGDFITPGNGSTVEVTLEVYDTGRFGKGTRLHEMKILDMVIYEKPEEATQDEYDSQGSDLDLDDDIPFEEPPKEVKSRRSSPKSASKEEDAPAW